MFSKIFGDMPFEDASNGERYHPRKTDADDHTMRASGSRRNDAVKVLMLSPDPSIPGGVVHFVELLKQHLSSTIRVESFVIGRRPEERGAVRAITRLLGDVARLVARTLGHRYAVFHLNPSLTEKSILRDGLFLLIVRVLGRGRILIFFHGWRPALEQKILSYSLYRSLFRWLIGRQSCVLVLAQPFKNSLVALGLAPDQVKVFRTMFDGKEIGGRTGLKRTDPEAQTVLFLSRLERKKGVYELLEAFARIQDKFPRAELIMAGGGPEYLGLQRRVQDLHLGSRVKIFEYLRGSAKTDLLAQARIFALPSYYGEGMPIALLEAMAAGSAVLTSRVGGIPEIVTDPENGVLLDEISAESIEAGLSRLLGDEQYCARAGKANRERAWTHFEARPVTKDMIRLYGLLAGGEGAVGAVASTTSETESP